MIRVRIRALEEEICRRGHRDLLIARIRIRVLIWASLAHVIHLPWLADLRISA